LIEPLTGHRADLHGALQIVFGENASGHQIAPEAASQAARPSVPNVPTGEEHRAVSLGAVDVKHTGFARIRNEPAYIGEPKIFESSAQHRPIPSNDCQALS
jgi:hypothetical protein